MLLRCTKLEFLSGTEDLIIRVIVFLSMIDGYDSTVNTDQRLSAGEITYQWLLLKSGSVIYMFFFFTIDL